MAMHYSIEVLWEEDDQLWIAHVPDLPLCFGHGVTPHQAVQEVEVAIDAWIDAAKAEDRRIPPPATRTHSI